MLFAVLLPTVVLFVAQYYALSDLREKSKTALEFNLRQTFFEIENKAHEDLLEKAGTMLGSFPAESLDPWNSQQIKENLDRILEQNNGAESSFVTYSNKDKHYIAVTDPQGYRESKGGRTPEELYSAVNEEDFIIPFIGVVQSPLGQNVSQNVWTAQNRCKKCAVPGQTQNFYLYHMLSDFSEEKGFRLVGVRLKQDYLISEFLKPAVLTSEQTIAEKQGVEIAFAIFDEQKQLLYSNSPDTKGLDSFEIQTPMGRSFPFWTLAGSYRDDKIEELTSTYFSRGVFLMVLVFGLLILGVILIFRVTSREIGLAQAKSAFVSNVSHELKTPLALIRLFAETLESGRVKSPEKAQEYYRIITNETNRLTQLINNILDFSAIEAGRKEYKFSEQDLSEVVAEVFQNYSYGLESAGFKVESSFEDGLPKISIDRDAVSQAVLNLLTNTVKYSRNEKFVRISVERQNKSLAVSVTDHGIGIAPDEQDKIFDKFYRSGGASDVHNAKGSGLGLSLVKHIVEAHGGSVKVNSVLHRGSTFTITLPIETPENRKV